MEDNSGRGQIIVENHASYANKLLAACIIRKIQPMPSSRCCIYKVPEELRRVKEDAYLPKIVSIGPFHRGKEELQAMEENKKRYLHALLYRMSSTPEIALEGLVKVIRALEVYARGYYEEPIDLNSDEFVEMMLFDGCFILVLFYNYANKGYWRDNNDPIFNQVWMISCLQHDLMLLENQIPFVVLKHLFKLTRVLEQGGCSLGELVKCFFDDIIPGIVPAKSSIEGKHLLEMIHNRILIPCSKQMEVVENPDWFSSFFVF